MNFSKIPIILSFFALCMLCACSSDDDGSAATKLNIADQTPLPVVVGAGPHSCSEDFVYTELAICDWVESLDGIALGYVSKVELVRSPAKIGLSGAGYVTADECEGTIKPALKITLDVDKSIGHVPDDELEFYIGQGAFYAWASYPLDGDINEVAWQDSPNVNVPGGKIVEGQYIGVPLYLHSEGGIWSLMGEQLFTLVMLDELQIEFQGALKTECEDNYPPAVAGMDIDAFLSQAQQCTPGERSEERRSFMMQRWGSDKYDYMAAGCAPSHDPNQIP